MKEICRHCSTEFEKSVEHQIYCSSACLNRASQKRWKMKTKKKCPTCDEMIMKKSRKCRQCAANDRAGDDIKKMTIGEYQSRGSIIDKHPSWKNSHIRGFARSWNKNLLSIGCQKCGYSKHVEIAHIKPVSSFSDNSTLWEVNCPENIFILCPNCHWEFDNRLISQNDIQSR